MTPEAIPEGRAWRRILAAWTPSAALARAGGVTVAGHIAVALISLVALRVLTQLASPAVFGAANLTTTLLLLASTVAVGPFTNAQLRFHSQYDRDGQGDGFMGDVLAWSLAAAAGAAIAGALVYAVAARLTGHRIDAPLIGASAAYLLATTLRNVFVSRVHAERRQPTFVALLVAEAALTLAFTAAALALSDTAAAYVAGQALAIAGVLPIVAVLAPWPVLGAMGRRSRSPTFLRQSLTYGAPFAPVAAFNWVSNLADRYSLAYLMGAGAAGRYVAPFAIASRGMALSNAALVDFLRPVMFDAAGRGDHRQVARIFWSWLAIRVVIALAAVAFLQLFGAVVAQVFLAAPYREGAAPILVWVAGAYGVYGVTQTLEMKLMAEGRTTRLIAPPILGAAANVALSFLLVPRLGIVGAAQATCASFVLQCLATAAILGWGSGKDAVAASPEARVDE